MAMDVDQHLVRTAQPRSSCLCVPARRILLSILLTACPVAAERSWSVEAILNIPVLSDPQIRPDGRYYAYVQRSLAGSTWRSAVRMAPIASGAAREVATGARPRWSSDPLRL